MRHGPSLWQVGKEKEGTGRKDKVSWKEKRKLKEAKKVKTEAEQRQEGLAAAIPSSNIGFKLLQQMGYQPGNALGKHGQGAIEPVNVDLKFNRTGLGRDRVVQEEKILKTKFKALAQERKRKKVDELQVGFQERRRGNWQSRKLVSDYRKACTALLQLEEGAAAASMEGGVSKEGSHEPRAAATNGVEEEGDEGEEEEVITEEVTMLPWSLSHQWCDCYVQSSSSSIAVVQ